MCSLRSVNHRRLFTEDVLNYAQVGLYSDVELRGSHRYGGHPLPVNSQLLALCSPTLARVLDAFGGCHCDCGPLTIVVADTSHVTLRHFLSLIYTGAVELDGDGERRDVAALLAAVGATATVIEASSVASAERQQTSSVAGPATAADGRPDPNRDSGVHHVNIQPRNPSKKFVNVPLTNPDLPSDYDRRVKNSTQQLHHSERNSVKPRSDDVGEKPSFIFECQTNRRNDPFSTNISSQTSLRGGQNRAIENRSGGGDLVWFCDDDEDLRRTIAGVSGGVTDGVERMCQAMESDSPVNEETDNLFAAVAVEDNRNSRLTSSSSSSLSLSTTPFSISPFSSSDADADSSCEVSANSSRDIDPLLHLNNSNCAPISSLNNSDFEHFSASSSRCFSVTLIPVECEQDDGPARNGCHDAESGQCPCGGSARNAGLVGTNVSSSNGSCFGNSVQRGLIVPMSVNGTDTNVDRQINELVRSASTVDHKNSYGVSLIDGEVGKLSFYHSSGKRRRVRSRKSGDRSKMTSAKRSRLRCVDGKGSVTVTARSSRMAASLPSNLDNCNGSEVYKCSICNRVFKTFKLLKSHTHRAHNAPDFRGQPDRSRQLMSSTVGDRRLDRGGGVGGAPLSEAVRKSHAELTSANLIPNAPATTETVPNTPSSV